ncbi:MAG: hydrogenase maturation nickel metallochaperone HypA [Kineosporiaceae bacterium]
MAESIVRTVQGAVPGRTVVSVQVRVGTLSGVVGGALGFAWDIATAGTALAGSRLDLTEVPVRTACSACGEEADLPEPLPVRCPGCGGRDVDVVGGRDLELASVEVEDEVPAVGAR